VNVLLLTTMFVVDSRPLRDRARRLDITLDTVHTDDAALVADLERRLGGRVIHHVVNEIDYVRDTMVVDVRYRVGKRLVPSQHSQQQHSQQQHSQQQYSQQQYTQPPPNQPHYGQPHYGQPQHVSAAQW
jgi:hypothetical protein